MTRSDQRFDWRPAPSPVVLAWRLARQLADDLQAAIAAHGNAILVVSGGSTPKRLFAALSRQVLDWSHVVVLVADERWVPWSSPLRNERMVAHRLLRNRARSAQLLSLVTRDANPREAVDAVSRAIGFLGRPADALVLGMGGDGHTASLFPDAPNIEVLLNSDDCVAAAAPPSQPTPRITTTPRWFNAASRRYLHIEGAAKRQVFERACEPGPVKELPIRCALDTSASAPLQVYWSP